MLIKIIAFFLVSICISGLSASSNGIAGSTSTGSISINVTVPTQVVVTGLNDMVASWDGSGGLSMSDNICIGSNNSGQNYKIKATGDGAGNSFSLGTLDYSVHWASTANSQSGTSLISGTELGAQANIQTLSCVNDNATLIIDIAEEQLKTSSVGTYSGTITLIVTPE